MLFSALKFLVFTLALTLMLIWSTLPELWVHVFSLVQLVRENLGQLLYLLDDLSDSVHFLLSTEKNLVKRLTCDNLEHVLPEMTPVVFLLEEASPQSSGTIKCAFSFQPAATL
ncbi:hypothetical protein DSO57_1003635 [Entomophthora muscae]|uniref:Uncharacterized protein n=1 Tax=Entomophthora muscae TaxID=34485 RepID=A0ACC2SL39_9FUNG|nr:hypothetical protein DSO57_1003635 [Entomophthora muscae]